MTNTVDLFRSGFKGVRANRYVITPGTLGAFTSNIYVKALSLPGSQIGVIPVSYQGRQVKFSGERQFGEWAFVVYESADEHIRERFESWMEKMDDALNHKVSYNVSENWDVGISDSSVQGHPGFKIGSAGTKVVLHNVWPMDISPIDLSYDLIDSFAEFTVSLAYDYHTIT